MHYNFRIHVGTLLGTIYVYISLLGIIILASMPVNDHIVLAFVLFRFAVFAQIAV